MSRITRLPEAVARVLTPLKPSFSYRHDLVFCWLLVAHRVGCGQATVQGLARYTPTRVAAWHRRRLLAAGRWQWERVLGWLVSEALAAFPPPKGGVLDLVVDRTLEGKRGKRNPLAKRGGLNEYAPFTSGLPVVIVIAPWEVYRVPLACRLGKPQASQDYQSEKVLVREMLGGVVRPAWCKKVVAVADAAYPSRATLQARRARSWYLVIAFPRPGELATGQYLREVVPHLPLHYSRQVRVPLVTSNTRRRVFWPFAKRAPVAQGGGVTVVLSGRRRNASPKATKLLVADLPQATTHLTVAPYLRRWPVELCLKERKSVVGVGQHQVTEDAARVGRSVAVAVMAYLLLLRLRAKRIKPGSPWSAFTLKQELAWEGGAHQLPRTVRQETRKEIRRQRAAGPPPFRLAA
jgi:hypothetical protein